MPASTVPAAKASLKALLEAWPWPGEDPVIRWGYPSEGEDLPAGMEFICFGDTDVNEREQSLGGQASKEYYNLRIIVDVRQWGDDEQATEARAWELYGQVTDLLDANRTLSGVLVALQNRTSRQVNVVASPSQWRSQILIEQECIGHLLHP